LGNTNQRALAGWVPSNRFQTTGSFPFWVLARQYFIFWSYPRVSTCGRLGAAIIFHSLSSRYSVLEFFIYGVYIFLHFLLSRLSSMQARFLYSPMPMWAHALSPHFFIFEIL
jgi:hypothetical protein